LEEQARLFQGILFFILNGILGGIFAVILLALFTGMLFSATKALMDHPCCQQYPNYFEVPILDQLVAFFRFETGAL
jgi:hypothetical protein